MFPPTLTKLGEQAFSVLAYTVWNSLTPDIRCISDTNTFKRHLKAISYKLYFDF